MSETMNNEPSFTEALHYLLTLGPDEAVKRMKGVQGPEQGLVGESRSDRKQGHAEEAKPGERGVGEIATATKLRRHLSDKIGQAHRQWVNAGRDRDQYRMEILAAKHDALVDLRSDFDRMAEKRSDLSNTKDQPRKASAESDRSE